MITAHHRSLAGFALIAAGVVVAALGWIGVSGETEVAFQLPYFASAAVAALMLLGLGAASLISVQLQRDEATLLDLERAVSELADEVGRLSREIAEPRGTVTPLRSVPSSNGRRSPLRAAGS